MPDKPKHAQDLSIYGFGKPLAPAAAQAQKQRLVDQAEKAARDAQNAKEASMQQKRAAQKKRGPKPKNLPKPPPRKRKSRR